MKSKMFTMNQKNKLIRISTPTSYIPFRLGYISQFQLGHVVIIHLSKKYQ